MYKHRTLRLAFGGLFVALILFTFSLSGCSDDAMAPTVVSDEPFDDTDIRTKVYLALYEELRLDTLGCRAMAVAEGDSLYEGMFWPAVFIEHSPDIRSELAEKVPLRILRMEEVHLTTEPARDPPYATKDTGEPAIAAFTKTIERTGPFTLIVVCGVFHRRARSAFAACSLEYRGNEWMLQSLNPYYIRMWH